MTIIRYVDTASSGGDGTTQGHTGSTAAYSSLSAALTNEAADLTSETPTTSADGVEVAMFIRCAGTVDSTETAVTGFTLDATHYLCIEADDNSPPNSDGWNQGATFSTSDYYMEGGDVDDDLLEISDKFVLIRNLQFQWAGSTAAGESLILINDNTSGAMARVYRCRFRHDATSANLKGVTTQANQSQATIHSCHFDWSTEGSTANAIQFQNGNGTSEVWNCVAHGGDRGIGDVDNFTAICANSAFFSNGDDIQNNSLTWDVDNNCADDDFDTEFTSPDSAQDNEIFGTSPMDTVANEFTAPTASPADVTPVTDSNLGSRGKTGGPTLDLVGASFVNNDIGCFVVPTSGGGGGLSVNLAASGGLAGRGGLAGNGGGLVG